MTDRNVICVVEHQSEDRDVINSILSRAGYLVKDYETSAGFLAELATVHARCAIVDVRLPDINLPAFVSELARIRPDVTSIITTKPQDIPIAMEAMRAGAVDFVEKPVESKKLLHLLRHTVESRPPSTEMYAKPLRPCLIERLTPRERDVLDLLLQGYQNKMIAYELGISQRTVEVYRARVMRRLHVSSFAELVRVALEEQSANFSGISAHPEQG